MEHVGWWQVPNNQQFYIIGRRQIFYLQNLIQTVILTQPVKRFLYCFESSLKSFHWRTHVVPHLGNIGFPKILSYSSFFILWETFSIILVCSDIYCDCVLSALLELFTTGLCHWWTANWWTFSCKSGNIIYARSLRLVSAEVVLYKLSTTVTLTSVVQFNKKLSRTVASYVLLGND